MRTNVRIVIIACSVLLSCLGTYMMYQTIRELPIDWSGIGIFLTGMASIITGSLWAKSSQKKHEVEREKIKTVSEKER